MRDKMKINLSQKMHFKFGVIQNKFLLKD